jgi:hypothetical protein
MYGKTSLICLSDKVDGNIAGCLEQIVINDILSGAIRKHTVRILWLIQSQAEGRSASPAPMEKDPNSLCFIVVLLQCLFNILLRCLGYRYHILFPFFLTCDIVI